MPTSNPLDILLLHDAWATRQMLLACQNLAPGQFAQPFDIGPGSLQATLTHIIAAMKTWTDTLAQRPVAPRLEQNGIRYTPAQLLPLHDAVAAEFAALARAHPLDAIVKRTRIDKEWSFTRGAVVTHVTTHGMHHRAQGLNMLRRLGIARLPLSSVIEWSRAVDNPS
jgi:uncharacterized damage-inducible protein DinB